MRVLVTGALGFIGRHIIEGLSQAGHTVLAMDVYPVPVLGTTIPIPRNKDIRSYISVSPPTVIDGCELHLCDLYRRSAVDHIAALEPEALFHLAACAREGASWFQPAHVTQTNMAAYVNTLTGCLKHSGFKRVVLFSSMSVYGDQPPPFDEDMPAKPVDPYGLNKAMMEEMTKMLCDCHGISYVIVRPNNVFGPRQSLRDKYRNVLAIWCNCIMRGEEAWIFGDGEQTRAFSYIEDALPAYQRCLDTGINQTFNIGGMTPVTINEAWRVVSMAMGAPDHPVRHVPARYGEVKAAFCRQSRAAVQLGYEDTIGFERGVLKMAEYARAQGPQEWITDTLELDSGRVPEEWKA